MRVRAFIKRIGYAIKSVSWKRNKKIILLGSWYGEKFADNTRFLYQYLFENKDDLGLEKVIWVTRNEAVLKTMREMGYEVYIMDSPESIHYHKVAGYHIICNAAGSLENKGDIMGQYSYGAIRINLWHGLGNKQTGKLANSNKAGESSLKYKIDSWMIWHSRLYRRFYRNDGGWADCYFVVPTKGWGEIFKKEYCVNDDHLIESGYARNCPCPHLTDEETEILKKIDNHRYSVLYLPTFRQSGSFHCAEVVKGLLDYLEEKDILWIQKLHSADTNNRLDVVSDYVLNLDTNFDVNVLTPHIDIIITDYSSVFSDAMYHMKPIVFYTPDFEDYSKGENGFIFDPQKVMRGVFAYDVDELKKGINQYLSEPHLHLDKEYMAARSLYWTEQYNISDIWEEIKRRTDS